MTDTNPSSKTESLDVIDEALATGLNWIRAYESDVSGLSTSTEIALVQARDSLNKAIDQLALLRQSAVETSAPPGTWLCKCKPPGNVNSIISSSCTDCGILRPEESGAGDAIYGNMAQLVADAARYRWLRRRIGPSIMARIDPNVSEFDPRENLDRMVDARMRPAVEPTAMQLASNAPLGSREREAYEAELKRLRAAFAEKASGDEPIPRHTLDCAMVKHPNCTRCDCGSPIDPNYRAHVRNGNL